MTARHEGNSNALRPAAGRYRRQVVRNTIAAGIGNGWTALLMVVAIPVLVRGLGPTAFGLWAILQTFSAVSGWLALGDLGLALATTRAVADRHAVGDDDAARHIATTAIVTIGTIGVGWGLLLGSVGPRLLPSLFGVPDDLRTDFSGAVTLFAVQVAFELLGVALGAVLDGRQRVDISRLIDGVRRALVLAAAGLTALVTGDLYLTVLASAATTALTVLATTAAVVGLAGLGRGRPSPMIAGRLLREGRPIWLLNGTGAAHRTMDRTIVGIVVGPAAVGLVEIADRVQGGVAAMLSAATYSVTSSAAWVTARGDRDRLAELLLRGTRYACLITIPMCAVVAVLARPLVTIWVGDELLDAAGLVVLALVYLAVQAPVATGSNVLVGMGHTTAVTRPAVASVVVNAALSIVLVQRFGAAGAFVATIISGVLLSPMLLRAIDRFTGVPVAQILREGLVPAVVPAAAAAAAAVAGTTLGTTPWQNLLLGGSAALVAGGVAAVSLGLSPDDRAALRRRFRAAPTG